MRGVGRDAEHAAPRPDALVETRGEVPRGRVAGPLGPSRTFIVRDKVTTAFAGAAAGDKYSNCPAGSRRQISTVVPGAESGS